MNWIVHLLHRQRSLKGPTLVGGQRLRRLEQVTADHSKAADVIFGCRRANYAPHFDKVRAWLEGLERIEDQLTPSE